MASNVLTEQSASPSENSKIGKFIEIISNLRKHVFENLSNKTDTQMSPTNSNYKGGKVEIVVGENKTNPPASFPDEHQKNINGQNKIKDKQLSENSSRVDPLNRLDHDLKYMQYAIEKLKGFEDRFGESIMELKADLEIILTSIATKKSDPKMDSQRDEILRIYQKALNLKSKIPPVKGSPATDTDEQRRQRIIRRKNLPNMPNKSIFKKHPYFEEFKKKFEALDNEKKSCLLCFALFPENAVIKKRLLLHWWKGEGFISKLTHDDKVLTAETVADEILREFEKKGFILPVNKKHREVANSFCMSPLARSAVITLAKEKSFVDFDSEGIPTLNFKGFQRACLVYDLKEGSVQQRLEQLVAKLAAKELAPELLKAKNDDQNHTDAEIDQKSEQFSEAMALFNFSEISEQKAREFQKIMEVFKKGTKQDFEQDLERVEKGVKELADTRSKIGTLFNVSEEFPEFKHDWFSKMDNLKVLYLGRWQSTVDDIPHIEIEHPEYLRGLKFMKSLRLLSLQGISGIRELPNKEISYLEKLEILDIRACYNLEALPDNIYKLKNLTHLDISECFLFDGIPKKLCMLSNLQVLKGFVITDHAKDRHSKKPWCRLKDLEELKQLRKLSININSEKFETKELSVVLNFAELLELNVSWGWGYNNMKETGGREASKAPKKPSKLKKIDLQCFPDGNQPQWLTPENLKDLQYLYIRGGRLSSLKKKEWKSVKVLRLKYLNELEIDWIELQELFPNLKYLEKFKCDKVTLCPCDGYGVWEKTELENQYSSQ